MAIHETHVRSKAWVEVSVPTPCLSGDLYDAQVQARSQYHRHKGKLPDTDDAFEILTGDDQITIRFETTEKRAVVLTDGLDADLQQACALLAALVSDCIDNGDGRCMSHRTYDGDGRCFHSLARDFLTNKEENPYG